MNTSNEKQNIQKKFRFTNSQLKMLQELADERGTSANEVIVSALTSFYAQSKPSEHILTTFARETKKNVDGIAAQVADNNRLLNDFSMLFYYCMLPILGSIPNIDIAFGNNEFIMPSAWDTGLKRMSKYTFRMMVDQKGGSTFNNFLTQIWTKYTTPHNNKPSPNQGA